MTEISPPQQPAYAVAQQPAHRVDPASALRSGRVGLVFNRYASEKWIELGRVDASASRSDKYVAQLLRQAHAIDAKRNQPLKQDDFFAYTQHKDYARHTPRIHPLGCCHVAQTATDAILTHMNTCAGIDTASALRSGQPSRQNQRPRVWRVGLSLGAERFEDALSTVRYRLSGRLVLGDLTFQQTLPAGIPPGVRACFVESNKVPWPSVEAHIGRAYPGLRVDRIDELLAQAKRRLRFSLFASVAKLVTQFPQLYRRGSAPRLPRGDTGVPPNNTGDETPAGGTAIIPGCSKRTLQEEEKTREDRPAKRLRTL